jgi:hypothetical protein
MEGVFADFNNMSRVEPMPYRFVLLDMAATSRNTAALSTPAASASGTRKAPRGASSMTSNRMQTANPSWRLSR